MIMNAVSSVNGDSDEGEDDTEGGEGGNDNCDTSAADRVERHNKIE